MIKFFSLILVLAVSLLIGCGESRVKYGEATKNGVVFYPLCAKAKSRITDLQRISFELPQFFKQAPCQNWPDYTHSLRSESVSVEIPGVISNGSLKSVGGGALKVSAGYEFKGYYLSPDVFFADYKEYLTRRSAPYRLVTASWVKWSAGKCARFYSDNDTRLYVLRVVDYFCWEASSGSIFPIQIHATQNFTPDQALINLDGEFVEPVLRSIELYPISSEKLVKQVNDRVTFCATLKKSYDEKTAADLVDDLDQRRTIRYLSDCGYEISSAAVGVESWKDIFKVNGELIGKPLGNDPMVRKISKAQFSELETKLRMLRPRLGERPEATVRGLSSDRKGSVVKLRLIGPYDGEWYSFPPSYSQESGVGIRNDPEMGRVIDVFLWEGGIPLGLQIVSG